MRNLPSEYQEVEWIGSSGTQWINTGYTANSNIRIVSDFMMLGNNSNVLFGTTYGTWTWHSCLCFLHGSILVAGASSSSDFSATTNTKYNIDYSLTNITFNGESHSVSFTTGRYELTLFYGNTRGGSTQIYTFKIYDGTTLVRDLVPCYLKNGGTIGLYDLVNNVFYTNQGSGTFSKGADVLPPQRYTSKLYLNGSEFFFDEGVPTYQGLCFIANTAGSTVTLGKTGSPSIENTAYSTDGVNWTSYTPGSTGAITLTNIGDKVYFRNDITGNFSTSNYLQFSMTGSISASGNCNSMYSATGFETLTTLTYNYCFNSLFEECTALTTAPELPATTISRGCYQYMFNGCTSLTTVPELPATTLSNYCYSNMFQGCSNIKLSTTQTGEYQTPYRIPTSGTGTTGTDSLYRMFYNTGGTFTGTPSINTTYYTSNTVV